MAKKALSVKLSVEEFGEVCNQILDAFERGEGYVLTSFALKLVWHIQAEYQHPSPNGKDHDKAIELAQVVQKLMSDVQSYNGAVRLESTGNWANSPSIVDTENRLAVSMREARQAVFKAYQG